MPREEIRRLCDVHLALFREQLGKEKPEVAPDNPITILMGEHEILRKLAEELGAVVGGIQKVGDASRLDGYVSQLRRVTADLLDGEKHYLREENVLFPLLEKHGISEPPAIMWMEHDQIRERKKQLSNLVGSYSPADLRAFKIKLVEIAKSLQEILPSHLYKEDSILFPTALRVLTDVEWREAKQQFDEIGYCSFTPKHLIAKPPAGEVERGEVMPAAEGVVQFETGSLSKEEIAAILDTIPVDISFVDKDDAVKYFNKAEKRIFVRTKAVLGRKVQLCHPQKSVHVVQKIVEGFKSGKRDVAEFWIQVKGQLVLIRYFAVRGSDGKYLGTLEVSQDITDLKKVEGEKRLLDWK
jgi:PAS domain S-box-containing protein